MKPILFNTEMVRGVDAGVKTVTRRVVKPQPKGRLVPELPSSCWPGYFGEENTPRVVRSPYFVGDILYVRETFFKDNAGKYHYKADGDPIFFEDDIGHGLGWQFVEWRPSIHMPEEAARLFLRVTGIKAQRVQDITDEEARREGCADRADFRRVWNGCYAKPRPVKGEDGEIDHYESWPWEDIRETRTHKGKPWHVIGNPWVWVIEFKRITREEAEKQ